MDKPQTLARWRRPGRWIPVGIVALAVLGLAALRIASNFGVKRELAEIRQRGLPTTPLELDRWYKEVPAAENMALMVLEACGTHVEPSPGRDPSFFSRRNLSSGKRLPPEIREAAEDYVKKNPETLTQIHAASELHRSRFPIDLSSAPKVTFSPLMTLKRLVQLSKWDAILKSEEGNSDGALKSLTGGFAVAASLRDEPLLMSQLVRAALLSIQIDALEHTVTNVKFDSEALVRLIDATLQAEKDGKRSIFRAMAGERAFMLKAVTEITYDEYVQSFMSGGTFPGYENTPEFVLRTFFDIRRAIGAHDQDIAFFLRRMERLVLAAELDYPEMLRETEAAHVETAGDIAEHPVKYMVSALVLPSMGLAARKEVLLASRLRCARAALGIEHYRLRNNGSMPRLDELTPEFLDEWPRDAVDNQPLRYEARETSGFRVVAPAASELANEGRARSSTNWQDVAFTVAR